MTRRIYDLDLEIQDLELEILKLLYTGPKTLDEIRRAIRLEDPTILKHLVNLIEKGLVRQYEQKYKITDYGGYVMMHIFNYATLPVDIDPDELREFLEELMKKVRRLK